LQIKTKIVSCHTADSKPVKQEVNCTVILPPLVFHAKGFTYDRNICILLNADKANVAVARVAAPEKESEKLMIMRKRILG
jgi:hypothetical protein